MPADATSIRALLAALDPGDPQYATRFVDAVLTAARGRGASDLHLQPTPEGLDLKWRLDGVLVPIGTFPPGVSANVVARLKVLADLLTYRTDVPQEGRIRSPETAIEMRASTFPTLYGEKAVVRLFTSSSHFLQLADLKLGEDVEAGLGRLLSETSGAILVVGPAGSGKTTTLYACLREIAARSQGGRSIVTLEDPIEVSLPGVAQSQVNLPAGFDLTSGLRSIMRQDPEVILVGEIRDRATAQIALEASLTGQLVLSSFHAPSAAGAISRLLEMGLEPYVLRSGLLAVVSQRLLRKLCRCARPVDQADDLLGLPVGQARTAVGCEACAGTGFLGRMVLAEILLIEQSDVGRAILSRASAGEIEQLARRSGMIDRWQRACAAVEEGLTSPAEVQRVLGLGIADE
ncbi:MAG TPA: GspE/PulE family protein [Pirellulales bacterium]|jgi:type II secretory ATPase GspE/PulE/Tfp pilus assembly ATPase PilB-like protein|nr:GspE/PulE family protein [Pirellulales bacterium]